MAFITDPDNLTQATEIVINTGARTISLLAAGNLADVGSTAADNGVTGQALYSFLKEEWKNDALLIPYPFPMVAVTPEQFEFVSNWTPLNDTTRDFIRSAGWSEVDNDGNIKAQYAGVISLGSFEDVVNDQAYYQFGTDPTDTTASVNATYPGVLNEAVKTFEEIGNPATCTFATSSTITRATGSFITDGFVIGGQVTIRAATTVGNNGTYTLTGVAATTLTVTGTPFATGADPLAQLGVDNRNAFSVFLRVRDGDTNGKTFAKSDLTAIGLSTFTNKAERFPLGNATDLKILETDANISTISPYTEIELRYLDAAYNREVDSVTKRNFGIVIDVGTYSDSNGLSQTSTVFDIANWVGTPADYAGGSLIIHEGTDQGTHTISGTPINNAGTLEVTLTSALTASQSALSFTLQRLTPIVATAEEIYEKVQYELRQSADIDASDSTVTGATADEVLRFVGDTLETGQSIPSNPNGAGSGVIIEGFDSNDTNRLTFSDNTGTNRTFPFVAAGTITFNSNLFGDSGASYWMFYQYSTQTTVGDFVISGASGDTASLDSAGTNFPTLAQNDYVNLAGFTNEENNGVWQVTDASPTTGQFDAQKVNGATVVNETTASRTLDQAPINSPDAIIVQDNDAASITGTISGSSVAFTFDYDGNVQGSRTAATDAPILLRAIGLETAQFVEATGTITRATGLGFSLVAALERNYENA